VVKVKKTKNFGDLKNLRRAEKFVELWPLSPPIFTLMIW